MSNYGRNFEFRTPPHGAQRAGRHVVDSASAVVPLGAPIKVSGNGTDNLGLEQVDQAVAAAGTPPVSGVNGICVAEIIGYDGFPGQDSFTALQQDQDNVAAGTPVQMVSGDNIKVLLRNTYDATTAAAPSANRALATTCSLSTPYWR